MNSGVSSDSKGRQGARERERDKTAKTKSRKLG